MVRTLLLAVLLGLAAAAPAGAEVQKLKYRFGPLVVRPGQNPIEFERNTLKPPVDGYITGFKPDLVRRDGSVPPVDVIHLHHGVWISNGEPLFAAGEEKTIGRAPPGFGWRYRASDKWVMNHMIHNLTPTADEVYITYELDFVAADAPEAAGMRGVETLWSDVMGLSAYPVFDALRGTGGRDRRLTYPAEQPSLRASGYKRNRIRVPEDGALVGSGGHLHPGGLHTELWLERDGRRVRLFRSEARYWEPAGPVSWDMAMTVTPPDWRVGVRRGDVLEVTATYETRRASWYESMGIMSSAYDRGGSGPDPFVTPVDRPGRVTHGRLAENSNHGGDPFSGLSDPRRLLTAPRPPGGTVSVAGFLFGRGDLNSAGLRERPPEVRAGSALRFVNRDARRDIFHTISSCKAPCNRTTGVAYPIADGRVRFDSGELGFGPEGFTAAANRDTWRTPRSLKPGTYTYFCRVHPFMRGAFRVRG